MLAALVLNLQKSSISEMQKQAGLNFLTSYSLKSLLSRAVPWNMLASLSYGELDEIWEGVATERCVSSAGCWPTGFGSAI